MKVEKQMHYDRPANPFTTDVVKAIVEETKDKRLSTETLKPALAEAFKAYALALGTRTIQDDGRRDAYEVSEVLTRLQTTKLKWAKLDQSTRDSVETFLGPSEKPVAERLQRLIADLDEFARHSKRGKGNPGKAHMGIPVDIEPLKTFIAALRDFWKTSRLGEFSHRKRARKLEDDHPLSPAL